MRLTVFLSVAAPRSASLFHESGDPSERDSGVLSSVLELTVSPSAFSDPVFLEGEGSSRAGSDGDGSGGDDSDGDDSDRDD